MTPLFLGGAALGVALMYFLDPSLGRRRRARTRDKVVHAARVVNENGMFTIVYVVAHEPAGQRDLASPGVRERITAGLKSVREQALRAAYLAAARSDADVTNYLARKVVESQGKPPAK